MNRQSQAAVLFLLGVALLHAGTTDLYLRYVKAGLQPLLLASGSVLIVAALATAWYERRRAKEMRAPKGPAHPEPGVSWLLVLPLLALMLVAPPALGSYDATRTGTALQEPLAYPSLPATDPLRLSVVDYAGRAAYDHGRTLSGRRVQITGFVALDRAGTPYLVRMALNCCAADAQPVKIGLIGDTPPVLQPDTWLTVTGTYTARESRDPVNDGRIPFLDVLTAKPVPTPRDPYDESYNN
ncbi:TIGR03943 family putative permease subunit [Streptomyces cellostaticus]|uniref:TIGR03943 family putative permease subunit n=1 Tax=Streptomyces cellostaticus TaxID=67285 RepID=UPI002026C940|nr:TIGR03943 family protein [Streptomyces cellostaticus]